MNFIHSPTNSSTIHILCHVCTRLLNICMAVKVYPVHFYIILENPGARSSVLEHMFTWDNVYIDIHVYRSWNLDHTSVSCLAVVFLVYFKCLCKTTFICRPSRWWGSMPRLSRAKKRGGSTTVHATRSPLFLAPFSQPPSQSLLPLPPPIPTRLDLCCHLIPLTGVWHGHLVAPEGSGGRWCTV